MKRWLSLTFLLVFGAGIALGIFGVEFFRAAPRSHDSGTYELLTLEIPIYLVTNEEVYEELGLGQAQREEIGHLLAIYHEQVGQARTTLADVSLRLRRDVAELLDEEQRQGLASIQKRYTERETQQATERKLARLRSEIELEPGQEARAFQIFFDSIRERRQLWRSEPRPKRDVLRQRTGEVCAQRDERLKDILSESQFVAYRALQEREHRWRQRCKKRAGRHGERAGQSPKAPSTQPEKLTEPEKATAAP